MFTAVLAEEWRQLFSNKRVVWLRSPQFMWQGYAFLGTKRRFANGRDYYVRNYDYRFNERHMISVSKMIVLWMEGKEL